MQELSAVERRYVIIRGLNWLFMLLCLLCAAWNVVFNCLTSKDLLTAVLAGVPLCLVVWFALPFLIYLPLSLLMIICFHTGQFKLLGHIYQYTLSIWEKLPIRKAELFATTLAACGVNERMQGNYNSCESLLNRSLSNLEQLKEIRCPYLATTLSNLSGLYLEQKRYKEAEDCARLSISLWQAYPDREQSGQAFPLTNLAFIHMRSNNYQQAEESFRKAVELFASSTSKSLIPTTILMAEASCHLGLAELKYREGNRSDCEMLYKQAMKMSEDNKVPPNPLLLQSLNAFGLLLWQDGQYELAEELLNRACIISSIVPKHPEAVQSFSNYTALLKQLGRPEEATKFDALLK